MKCEQYVCSPSDVRGKKLFSKKLKVSGLASTYNISRHDFKALDGLGSDNPQNLANFSSHLLPGLIHRSKMCIEFRGETQ